MKLEITIRHLERRIELLEKQTDTLAGCLSTLLTLLSFNKNFVDLQNTTSTQWKNFLEEYQDAGNTTIQQCYNTGREYEENPVELETDSMDSRKPDDTM